MSGKWPHHSEKCENRLQIMAILSQQGLWPPSKSPPTSLFYEVSALNTLKCLLNDHWLLHKTNTDETHRNHCCKLFCMIPESTRYSQGSRFHSRNGRTISPLTIQICLSNCSVIWANWLTKLESIKPNGWNCCLRLIPQCTHNTLKTIYGVTVGLSSWIFYIVNYTEHQKYFT